jgi:hypothetical protein
MLILAEYVNRLILFGLRIVIMTKKRVQKSLRVDPDHYEIFSELARRRGSNPSAEIRDLIFEYIQRYEGTPEYTPKDMFGKDSVEPGKPEPE